MHDMGNAELLDNVKLNLYVTCSVHGMGSESWFTEGYALLGELYTRADMGCFLFSQSDWSDLQGPGA